MIKGVDYIGIAVVYFCHDGKGNFLMHKRGAGARDENGKWDIGAGGIEFGDTAEQTLRKEIMEEYGTEVKEFEFMGYRNDIYRKTPEGKPIHWISLDFKVLVDPKMVKNGEPHKFDEFAWFSKGQLPSPTHSQIPRFMEKYQDQLWK